jgi:hypothetical protein
MQEQPPHFAMAIETFLRKHIAFSIREIGGAPDFPAVVKRPAYASKAGCLILGIALCFAG